MLISMGEVSLTCLIKNERAKDGLCLTETPD